MPVVPTPPVGQGVKYVHCGTLIDGNGGQPRKGVTLVIEDDVIRDVLDNFQDPPDGAELIDGSDKVVLPGLMDVHVHLVSLCDPEEPNALYSMMLSTTPMLTLWAARNARLSLEAGFTTVRDVAGYMNWSGQEVVAVRNAINKGLIPGPRVYAAAWVSQTAGHVDLGLPPTWPRDPKSRADGPWALRQQVRELIRNDVDFIKTASSGGGGDHVAEIWWRNHTVEELKAIVDEAHAVGKRVAVHAHTDQSVRNAVEAGADTIEHATYASDEILEVMAERGIYHVPTLSVRSDRGVTGRKTGAAHPHIQRKSQSMHGSQPDILARSLKAGCKIACGTDTFLALREHWGENAYEMVLMVDQGMTPMQAIVSATKTSAETLGIEDNVGTLEAGKWADLLVFDGNPIEDIASLMELDRIKVVMRGGDIAVDRRSNQSA
jgi:imidazolonepropionase-like amidohydrolase